ncbi:MAG: SDR family NAD(P)-dependent oxidoreductase [Candidatus Aenigmarchaeota archaeon]|nr:SDR family NAD(P)-dependent oxidoreductase [Candidatus Aenigmarchaeota archaeon]
MKTALITGGAGFIGFHLAGYLHKNGRKVVIADNLFRGKMDDELKRLLDSGVHFVQCDITKPEDFEQLGSGYDEVYHLAAIQGTKHFYEIPHEVLRVNVLGVINILEWFVKSKSKKILFASSSEAYAGTYRKFGVPIPTPEDVPLAIEDHFNPRWSYGGSKIIGELFFINYARMHKFPMSIIRYHNVYGPRMGHDHVIPEFCKRIFAGENPFLIKGGENTRAFCYVDDAIRATTAVMESEKTNGEIVHIGKEEEISILDLASKMLSIAGSLPELKIEPAPEGSVHRRCPSTSKLRTLTGFVASIPLEEGLRKTMDWYRKLYSPELPSK